MANDKIRELENRVFAQQQSVDAREMTFDKFLASEGKDRNGEHSLRIYCLFTIFTLYYIVAFL